MNDYIKRDDAIENIDELYFSDKDDHDRTREAIKRLSAADVVEVVRCKDCKHRKKNTFCLHNMRYEDDNGFCSYGERKDEGL